MIEHMFTVAINSSAENSVTMKVYPTVVSIRKTVKKWIAIWYIYRSAPLLYLKIIWFLEKFLNNVLYLKCYVSLDNPHSDILRASVWLVKGVLNIGVFKTLNNLTLSILSKGSTFLKIKWCKINAVLVKITRDMSS